MKTKLTRLIKVGLSLSLLIILLTTFTTYPQQKTQETPSQKFVIKFKPQANISKYRLVEGVVETGNFAFDMLCRQYKVRNMERVFLNSAKRVEGLYWTLTSDSNTDNLEGTITNFRSLPIIDFAEKILTRKLAAIPNDCLYNTSTTCFDSDFGFEQWGLHNDGTIDKGRSSKIGADIDAERAWDITTGDTSVVIAFVDTGIDWEHPEFRGNIWVNPGEDGKGLRKFTASDSIDYSQGGALGDFTDTSRHVPGYYLNNDDGDDSTDFHDPDIRDTDYDGDSTPLCGPNGIVDDGDDDQEDRAIAAKDDDENGLPDDIIGWDFDNDYYHMVGYWNPRKINSDPFGNYNHGTRVASIACAIGNNSPGTDTTQMAGVAWKSKIMMLKVQTWPTSDLIARAIDYATRMGAKIINMSIFDTGACNIERIAIENAINAGIFITASAGNDNSATSQYPACYTNVCGVMSTKWTDEKGDNSNYNAQDSTWYDIAAPGSAITFAVPLYAPNGLANWKFFGQNTNGDATSYSAPFVSGTAVLMKAKHPNWTGRQILHQIRNAAENIDRDLQLSYKGRLGEGRLNAYKALGYFHHSRGHINSNKTWRYFLFIKDTAYVDTAYTLTLRDSLTINSDVPCGLVLQKNDTLFLPPNEVVWFPSKFYLELNDYSIFKVGKNAHVIFGDSIHFNIKTNSILNIDTSATVEFGKDCTIDVDHYGKIDIMPRTTIKSGSSTIFNVHGQIVSKATSGNEIIFTLNGSPLNPNWTGIKIFAPNPSYLTLTNTFEHTKIKYADVGIESERDSVTIKNCLFDSNETGVKTVDATPLIQNNTFKSHTSAGIYATGSTRTILGNIINSNEAYGIIADGNSNLWIGNHADSNNVGLQTYSTTTAVFRSNSATDTLNGNTFRYNSDRGIIADNSSPVFTGDNDTDANNSCHDNNSPTADIDALNYSDVSGVGNYVQDSVSLYHDGTSTLDWSKQKMWDPISNAPSPPKPTITSYDTIKLAISKRLKGEYTNSMSLLKDVIAGNHNGQYAPIALRLIMNIMNDAEFINKNNDPISQNIKTARDNFETYLENLKLFSPSSTLKLCAAELFTNHKMRTKKFSAADSLFESLALSNPNTELEKRCFYGQAVARKIMHNQAGAKTKADLLRSKYPDDRIGVVAKIFIGEQLTDDERKMISKKVNLVPTLVSNQKQLSYELYQNYPNPFNPLTHISFSIPDKCTVMISIYDALGRRIKMFGPNEYVSGINNVIFNASQYSSGIYFYEIRAAATVSKENFHSIKKMALIR